MTWFWRGYGEEESAFERKRVRGGGGGEDEVKVVGRVWRREDFGRVVVKVEGEV